MKKILAIILVAIMSIVLLGCGKSQIDSVASDANQVKDALQFGTTEGKKENRSEKGSISDPYTISDTISFNAYPVSYTHLDVYKRQVHRCQRRNEPASSGQPKAVSETGRHRELPGSAKTCELLPGISYDPR